MGRVPWAVPSATLAVLAVVDEAAEDVRACNTKKVGG
jgi:hypothetical protein